MVRCYSEYEIDLGKNVIRFIVGHKKIPHKFTDFLSSFYTFMNQQCSLGSKDYKDWDEKLIHRILEKMCDSCKYTVEKAKRKITVGYYNDLPFCADYSSLDFYSYIVVDEVYDTIIRHIEVDAKHLVERLTSFLPEVILCIKENKPELLNFCRLKNVRLVSLEGKQRLVITFERLLDFGSRLPSCDHAIEVDLELPQKIGSLMLQRVKGEECNFSFTDRITGSVFAVNVDKKGHTSTGSDLFDVSFISDKFNYSFVCSTDDMLLMHGLDSDEYVVDSELSTDRLERYFMYSYKYKKNIYKSGSEPELHGIVRSFVADKLTGTKHWCIIDFDHYKNISEVPKLVEDLSLSDFGNSVNNLDGALIEVYGSGKQEVPNILFRLNDTHVLCPCTISNQDIAEKFGLSKPQLLFSYFELAIAQIKIAKAEDRNKRALDKYLKEQNKEKIAQDRIEQRAERKLQQQKRLEDVGRRSRERDERIAQGLQEIQEQQRIRRENKLKKDKDAFKETSLFDK